MSDVESPIHPRLALRQRKSPLRPEQRVANRGDTPLVSLHIYGVAADQLATGINRVYA